MEFVVAPVLDGSGPNQLQSSDEPVAPVSDAYLDMPSYVPDPVENVPKKSPEESKSKLSAPKSATKRYKGLPIVIRMLGIFQCVPKHFLG